MKKSLVIVLFLFFILTLSACSLVNGKTYVFTSEVITKNLPKVAPSKVRDNTIYDLELPSTNIIDKTYLHNAGILIVEDDQNNKTCWSTLAKGFIFPYKENIEISVFSVWFTSKNAYYIKTTTPDMEVTVYDVFGNIVIKPDNYFSFLISGEFKSLYLNNEEEISEVYVETISTVTRSDFDSGEKLPKNVNYIIDEKTGTRQKLLIPSSGFYQSTSAIKTDLKDYGLEGYFGRNIDTFLYVYDIDDKLVNTINLNGVYSFGGIDGKLIYQKIHEVNDESQDYSFIKNGKKCLLSSYSLDILTGKQKELKLDYLIESFSVFIDENDEYKYGYVNAYKIENTNLIEEEDYILIDSNGKKVAESGPINLLRLKKLDDEHFYDYESGYILNGKFEPMFIVDSNIRFSPNKNLIFLKKDDLFGAINYDGEIVIPFEYVSLDENFYLGKVLGTHIDGRRYLVEENSKYYIEGKWVNISPGLLYSYKYNSEKGLYEGIISDYNSVEKVKVETPNAVSFNFETFTNIYGNYMAKEYITEDGNTYIFIDNSYKEIDAGN